MSIKYSYAYADESGDTGYVFDRGSSKHFVLVVILPEQPEQTIDQLLALRRSLGKAETYEFHFHQADESIRSAFFKAISELPVTTLASVIHKQYAPTDFRRLGKVGVYSHALAGLSLRAPFSLKDCKLHLDGKGKQREFLQALKSNIRWACRVTNRTEQSFQEIRLLQSAHPLIQYADMVTGAISVHVNNGNSRWVEMLNQQIKLVWHEKFEEIEDKRKRNSPD